MLYGNCMETVWKLHGDCMETIENVCENQVEISRQVNEKYEPMRKERQSGRVAPNTRVINDGCLSIRATNIVRQHSSWPRRRSFDSALAFQMRCVTLYKNLAKNSTNLLSHTTAPASYHHRITTSKLHQRITISKLPSASYATLIARRPRCVRRRALLSIQFSFSNTHRLLAARTTQHIS